MSSNRTLIALKQTMPLLHGPSKEPFITAWILLVAFYVAGVSLAITKAYFATFCTTSTTQFWAKPPENSSLHDDQSASNPQSTLLPKRKKHIGFHPKRVPDNLDVIVIGSGIGGLCAASTLAKEGKRVCVLEQHDTAGGCCHTYLDQGFEFDTGLHYVGGQIWREDERMGNRKLMDMITDGAVRWHKMGDVHDVSIIGGAALPIRSGKQAHKKDLMQAFPDEIEAIEGYFSACDQQQSAAPLFFIQKLLPVWLGNRLRNVMCSAHESFSAITTLEKLQSLGASPELIARITYHYGNIGLAPSASSFANTAMMAQHYWEGAAYPVGGPSVIPQACVEAIEKRGGAVLVRAAVEQILVDAQGKACGVRVAKGDGVEVRAPVIISSAGVHVTFNRLIPEEHRPAHVVKALQSPEMRQSCAHLSLTIGLEGSGTELQLPTSNAWISPSCDASANQSQWYGLDGSADAIAAHDFPAVFLSFPSAKDPSWDERNPGKSTCHIIAEAPYSWFEQWKDCRIHHRGEDYEEVKSILSEKLLNVLYTQFPQCNGKVKLCRLGTPLSSEYFLGAAAGASYGVAGTPTRFGQDWLNPQTHIPGLYLTGQDIVSGGVTGAQVAGLFTAIAVCKRVLWSQMDVVSSL